MRPIFANDARKCEKKMSQRTKLYFRHITLNGEKVYRSTTLMSRPIGPMPCTSTDPHLSFCSFWIWSCTPYTLYTSRGLASRHLMVHKSNDFQIGMSEHSATSFASTTTKHFMAAALPLRHGAKRDSVELIGSIAPPPPPLWLSARRCYTDAPCMTPGLHGLLPPP